MTATKTLRDVVISGHVTLSNNLYNLCCNGATKLRDKLQEKLPISVTATLHCPSFGSIGGKKAKFKTIQILFFNSSQGRPSNISATLMKALEEYACEISR